MDYEGFFWSPESPWSYFVTICFPPSSCMMCVLEKHLILFIFFFKTIWPNLTSFGLWYGVRGPYISWVFMKFMNPTPAGDLNFRWKLKKICGTPGLCAAKLHPKCFWLPLKTMWILGNHKNVHWLLQTNALQAWCLPYPSIKSMYLQNWCICFKRDLNWYLSILFTICACIF